MTERGERLEARGEAPGPAIAELTEQLVLVLGKLAEARMVCDEYDRHPHASPGTRELVGRQHRLLGEARVPLALVIDTLQKMDGPR